MGDIVAGNPEWLTPVTRWNGAIGAKSTTFSAALIGIRTSLVTFAEANSADGLLATADRVLPPPPLAADSDVSSRSRSKLVTAPSPSRSPTIVSFAAVRLWFA